MYVMDLSFFVSKCADCLHSWDFIDIGRSLFWAKRWPKSGTNTVFWPGFRKTCFKIYLLRFWTILIENMHKGNYPKWKKECFRHSSKIRQEGIFSYQLAVISDKKHRVLTRPSSLWPKNGLSPPSFFEQSLWNCI